MARGGQRGISLPKDIVSEVEELVKRYPVSSVYSSVTDFIKSAIRARLGQERLIAQFGKEEGPTGAAWIPRCPVCRAPVKPLSEPPAELGGHRTLLGWSCEVGCGTRFSATGDIFDDAAAAAIGANAATMLWIYLRGLVEGRGIPSETPTSPEMERREKSRRKR